MLKWIHSRRNSEQCPSGTITLPFQPRCGCFPQAWQWKWSRCDALLYEMIPLHASPFLCWLRDSKLEKLKGVGGGGGGAEVRGKLNAWASGRNTNQNNQRHTQLLRSQKVISMLPKEVKEDYVGEIMRQNVTNRLIILQMRIRVCVWAFVPPVCAVCAVLLG